MKSHTGGQERVCIIAIARVCYRGNLSVISVCVSPGAGSCLQWQSVCNNEVIAGLESIVD